MYDFWCPGNAGSSPKTLSTPQHANDLLDLHLGETVLPDSHEWGNAVLAVVEEDDPG